MADIKLIEINQFRGIQKLVVSDFSRINLIVGDNNCGKTTFLEAIQLLFTNAQMSSVKNIIKQRTVLNPNDMSFYVSFADDERMKKVREARINSLDIFKSKGKELQCIIPISGPFERFTLSEDTIRFLVLSLIQPGDKMTLKMFLEKLYQNYRIVIGPEEYRKSMQDSSMDSSLANSFSENVVAFQQFLRSTGFLKELSDATVAFRAKCKMFSRHLQKPILKTEKGRFKGL